MSTHRRHRSGLLAKAVDSVLKQTYRDFELIIVDDCSFDGTADYLRQIAESDKRVKIIRNEENVNSVAVSLGRAFAAAATSRQFFTWMFDDNVLREDAFERLIFAATSRNLDVCFGETICHNLDGSRLIVGNQPLDVIKSGVPNSAILVPNAGLILKRSVIEKVGWYDSNILLRRSCDWDFFCRVFACNQLRVDKIEDELVEEYGGLQPDSLRNTNRTSFELMSKYQNNRNLAGWITDLYSALHYPEDRIPSADWTGDELKLIYSIFVEYYISTGNFKKAYHWSRKLISGLKDKPFYLDLLEQLAMNPEHPKADQSLGAISVVGNMLYLGEISRWDIQSEEWIAVKQAEVEKWQAKEREIDQELVAYKSSVAHRTASHLSRQIRKNRVLHSFLRAVLLGLNSVRLSLFRLQSQN
jgi:glycosyltransferase involved in cell wall biosynthesis